ncbi:hypothetical protein HCN51_43555, partial [Nonomuraea sp. FMUSA5-5]|nr:hypothetical protein [Nonomuraea sp. FMUSA5-5]
MDQRTEQLGQRAAHNPPEWALRRLGQVPDEPLLRHEHRAPGRCRGRCQGPG